MAQGLHSKGIKLSYGTSASNYTELTDLQEIPELGGTPNKIDVTTLDNDAKAYIKGLVDYGDLSFKFLYATEQFKTLDALTGVTYWKVTLPDSTTATFTGESSVKLDSVGVDAALTYTLDIALNSKIEFSE